MTSTRRLLATTTTSLVVAAGLLATTAAPVEAHPDHTHLYSVGDRYVGAAIPVVGYLNGTGWRHDKTLVLQRKKNGSWHNSGRLPGRADGEFRFPPRRVYKPQAARWRVVVRSHNKVVHMSHQLVVNVIPRPVV